MLYLPAPSYEWRLSSQAGVRPTANYGTAVTPGNNSKGSWAQVFSAASVVNEVWGVWINILGGQVTTAARDIIVDIGIDPAGGTSYSVHIPDLIGSCASFHSSGINAVGGGHSYFFPLFIPAGSSIAARASVNNATVGTVRVWMKIYGKPTYPELTKRGSVCAAFGIVSASSRGTAVTPGGASDGAWVSLGTTSREYWFWQVGMGVNDSTMSSLHMHGDLSYGDGSTKIMVVEDAMWITDSVEGMANVILPFEGMRQVPNGSELFVRAQCSGTADAAYAMAAWGVH